MSDSERLNVMGRDSLVAMHYPWCIRVVMALKEMECTIGCVQYYYLHCVHGKELRDCILGSMINALSSHQDSRIYQFHDKSIVDLLTDWSIGIKRQ